MRSATFQPTIPSVAWPVAQSDIHSENPPTSAPVKKAAANDTHRSTQRAAKQNLLDEFGFNEEDDLALMQLAENNLEEESQKESQSFEDIDTAFTRTRMQSSTQRPGKLLGQRNQKLNETALLSNGRYRCQHRCKDKRKCSHKCCQDGMDHPPKVLKQSSTQPAKSRPPKNNDTLSKTQSRRQNGTQNTLRRHSSGIGELDLTAESLDIRDQAPAERALQQLRTKVGEKNPQQIAQRKIYDVQHRDNQDDFQLPNFDDEELDDILDSDVKSGYMLAGETIQPSETLEVDNSDESLPRLSTNAVKINSRNDVSAAAKDDMQMTAGEYNDYDFHNYVNWDSVDVPVHDNDFNDMGMALDQGADDNRSELPSRISSFTAPLTATIPTTSTYRKRPSADCSTNVMPIISSSAKKISALQERDCNIFSPSKRLKSMGPVANEMIKKATRSTYVPGHGTIAYEKKAELVAWFNSEFGHCAVLVDIEE
jgi:hypothetical protein